MADLIPWISAVAGAVAAVAAWARLRVEREHNKVLRRQQGILEEQLAETREARAQSKAVDLRILDLQPTGGGDSYVDFTFHLANYGTRPCRCTVTALVGAEAAKCHPPTLDIVANSEPPLVRVLAPRPQLGDLMPECNNETTLFGETLVVQVANGDYAIEETWKEPVYDPQTHRERHEIQQRYWRMGRGEETEADRRAEYLAERTRRVANREENEPEYEL